MVMKFINLAIEFLCNCPLWHIGFPLVKPLIYNYNKLIIMRFFNGLSVLD